MYDSASFGAAYIQVIYFLLSFVLPVVFMISMCVLYMVPMKVQF